MAYTVLYIATSKDGFIADKQGNVDWLPEPSDGSDCGFADFLATVDVIAQGSRTFNQTLSFIKSGIVEDLPYDGKHMYVFTHEPMETDRSDVTFVSSIEEFLSHIDNEPEIRRIWLLGGAQLIASFKEHDLIDECIITVVPTILKEGIALPRTVFEGMKKRSSLDCADGIVQKIYVRK